MKHDCILFLTHIKDCSVTFWFPVDHGFEAIWMFRLSRLWFQISRNGKCTTHAFHVYFLTLFLTLSRKYFSNIFGKKFGKCVGSLFFKFRKVEQMFSQKGFEQIFSPKSFGKKKCPSLMSSWWELCFYTLLKVLKGWNNIFEKKNWNVDKTFYFLLERCVYVCHLCRSLNQRTLALEW